MQILDNLKETLNDFRNSIKNELSDDELKEVDKYIKKVIVDMTPIATITESLKVDSKELENMKSCIDNIIREEEWLEKLLKTS